MDWTRFPKVDLHRHLEGSLRLSTLEAIAAAADFRGPAGALERIRTHVAGDAGERSPEAFLAVFPLIRHFFVSPEIIARLAYEAAADAARDGVRHLELRFNPVALSEARGLPLYAAVEAVAGGVELARREHGLAVALIVTLNRAERSRAEELLRLAVDGRLAGIDLAGDELGYDADPFRGIFAEAAAEGLGRTVHAGEWGGAGNVRLAIEGLGAERIGHGIRVVDDEGAAGLARERGTHFEVCLSSNLLTGAVTSLEAHPLLEMRRRGLVLSLNTDDPALSDVTLSGEHALAAGRLGLDAGALRDHTLRAAAGAFLPPRERQSLIDRLAAEFAALEEAGISEF